MGFDDAEKVDFVICWRHWRTSSLNWIISYSYFAAFFPVVIGHTTVK